MKLACPYLSQFPCLKHAFFEADPHILTSNRSQAMEAMASRALSLITLKQMHGDKVIDVTKYTDNEKEGDGLVTCIKGIALGILTADCGPALFYDPKAKVIGASHAGWRGARAGILQKTLLAMEKLGAKRSQIYATLGPTIQQKHYEVGPEFPDLIGEVYETYFLPSEKPGHHYFNLPRYIIGQLLNEGLAQVYDLDRDTFTGAFSSRRRLLSLGIEAKHFNNLSAIAMV